jgi:uncharacterized membrane protein
MDKLNYILAAISLLLLIIIIFKKCKQVEKFEEDDKENTISIIQRLRDTINRILGREIESVEQTEDDEVNMANSA